MSCCLFLNESKETSARVDMDVAAIAKTESIFYSCNIGFLELGFIYHAKKAFGRII